MCCNNRCSCGCRCRCRENEEVQGIQEIALRGPGCINGTARCNGLLAIRGERFNCGNRFPIASEGTCCERLFGNSEERPCGQVFGSGGGFQCNNMERSCRRHNRCNCCIGILESPTTVPR